MDVNNLKVKRTNFRLTCCCCWGCCCCCCCCWGCWGCCCWGYLY